MASPPSPPVSIAPMMEWTDRHYRYFMRRITRHTLLYTEMITAAAIVHGDRDHLLGFDESEHPVSLQLGGDDPAELASAVGIADAYGYDEYNLNVGCPSDRVQQGRFGACLMAHPDHVRRLIDAMRSSTDRPVTVKHRIGIDGRESYEHLIEFVQEVNRARPARFTVHARIAVLNGLSPKDNRSIPPLRYEDVYRLKRELPDLQIEINGQIATLEEIDAHLQHVDATMLGRAAYDHPWLFADVDARYFGADPALRPTRRQVVEAMIPYLERWCRAGRPARNVLRHMLGLFSCQPGARHYRRVLSGQAHEGPGLLRAAVERISDMVLDGP